MSTYPEVFEPAETDQLAKYLNQRRHLLEDFLQSPMPVPPMPLLPPPASLANNQDAIKRERARSVLDWSVKGIVGRERWVITKADLEVIKAEIGSLRRAAKQAETPRISAVFSKVLDWQMETPLLTRASIKKMPRFQLRPGESSSTTPETEGVPQSRPLRNTCQTFAQMKKKYGPVPIEVEDDADTSFRLAKTVTVAETW